MFIIIMSAVYFGTSGITTAAVIFGGLMAAEGNNVLALPVLIGGGFLGGMGSYYITRSMYGYDFGPNYGLRLGLVGAFTALLGTIPLIAMPTAGMGSFETMLAVAGVSGFATGVAVSQVI
jgi:hypothetical protein